MQELLKRTKIIESPMQNRENFLPFFLVFFGLSLILILLGNSGIINSLTSFISRTAEPTRNSTIDLFSLEGFKNKQIKNLIEENMTLRKQVSEKQSLTLENKALKDQFAKGSSNSQSLLPAKVIGAPGFIPGVSLPEYLIIDKGSKDGVSQGSTIIIENNLVGKVIGLFRDFSKVELLINKNSSFTAKVGNGTEEVSGIIKGEGSEEMILENVLLTSNLKKDGLVLTKGDKDENGLGYPPDLIIGKITGVEKKESELFQKAKVLSKIDFRKLTYVFVLQSRIRSN